jgi:hypothetical protein
LKTVFDFKENKGISKGKAKEKNNKMVINPHRLI